MLYAGISAEYDMHLTAKKKLGERKFLIIRLMESLLDNFERKGNGENNITRSNKFNVGFTCTSVRLFNFSTSNEYYHFDPYVRMCLSCN